MNWLNWSKGMVGAVGSCKMFLVLKGEGWLSNRFDAYEFIAFRSGMVHQSSEPRFLSCSSSSEIIFALCSPFERLPDASPRKGYSRTSGKT